MPKKKKHPTSDPDQLTLDAYTKTLEDLIHQGKELSSDPAALSQWEQKLTETLQENWDVFGRAMLSVMDSILENESAESADVLRRIVESHQEPPTVFPPKATVRRARDVEYPLDKVNAKIWNLLEKDTAGQIGLKAEKSGSKKSLTIYYSIDFDKLGEGITITKRLTSYDKRVYIAVSALFNAGNNIISLTQIYYAMGYTGKPGKTDLERINEAVTKMTGARIYVSNEQEATVYNYPKFKYDGSLLPIERTTVTVQGSLADAAIHIFREPPVISFAKQRKQITTVNVELLQSSISKTEGNLLIEDYLIERISRARIGGQPRRILYKTLYENARITTSKQRQRVPDKVRRYLEHYQKCGLISRFTMEDDGITVFFSLKSLEPDGKDSRI